MMKTTLGRVGSLLAACVCPSVTTNRNKVSNVFFNIKKAWPYHDLGDGFESASNRKVQ